MRAIDDDRPAAWPIRAEGLSVHAGRRLAIEGVDLDLGPGVHGVLGPNGAGKTTLLRALATVTPPAAGTLDLIGQSIHGGGDVRAVRRQLGYLPQAFGYYKRFTVREFVEYLAWLKELPAHDIPAAAQRAIDQTGLTGCADEKLRTLSGGMIRRVGLAQALVGDPGLLILDEPTAGVDPGTRQELRVLLRGLGRTACVVIATHVIEDVAVACTDLVVLREGRIVFRGTPAELAAHAGAGEDDDVTSRYERGYAEVLR
ncbi:ATP-binding cassette domain-containing protein [Catenuloplanes atrovinosus]|uniref:ABC-type multidrug transport system ATPase subunit n=1 Tax=Catenuloplanes atrovinosus TaxID=137266 RepID=A0AAE4CCP0_9ACTN|nr:ATP-binding cassette domain-containing protein [Catenuloplanes atrovinosus]MDR7276720.1 ABC-type multidrug transport system ATPase subunit [Catenuloplanes atrovinosus]